MLFQYPRWRAMRRSTTWKKPHRKAAPVGPLEDRPLAVLEDVGDAALHGRGGEAGGEHRPDLGPPDHGRRGDPVVGGSSWYIAAKASTSARLRRRRTARRAREVSSRNVLDRQRRCDWSGSFGSHGVVGRLIVYGLDRRRAGTDQEGAVSMFERQQKPAVAADEHQPKTVRRRASTSSGRPFASDGPAGDGPAAAHNAADWPGSRIAPSTVPAPAAGLTPVVGSRIQRRVVTDKRQDPLPGPELNRIRLAVDRGADPERMRLRLGQLIEDPDPWEVSEVLAILNLDVAVLPTAAEAAIAYGRRPGFEFFKSFKYRDDPWTMSFERDETTLDDDERTKPVYLVRNEGLQVPVIIRGYRSEDERPVVARDRAYEVRRALVAAGYVSTAAIDPTSEGTAGNFDYREMRRVEILLPANIPPPKLDDGRVLGTDARYGKYGMKASIDGGQGLIDRAVAKLRTISADTATTDPVMATFRRLFTTADPALVVRNLQLTRAQIEHYRPEAPADAAAREGGHACLDESRPGLFYLNEGTGEEARMIAGVLSLTATPGAKAYNIVHEATHGTPALATRDHAYEWQRLFSFLTPTFRSTTPTAMPCSSGPSTV